MIDAASSPLCQHDRTFTEQSSHRRSWLTAVVAVSFGALVWASPSTAGFPEAIERGGRFCGCGYGDGYHTCYSSGMRPLANLPPRTFPARVGTAGEKIYGCPRCGHTAFPGIDPMRSPAANTFYHRFDLYASAVSRDKVNARPIRPLNDPEEHVYHSYSQLDPDGNQREHSRRMIPSPFASQSTDHTLLNGEDPTQPPQMTEAESQQYRQYLEQKRLRKKFDKYLIEPEKTEPNQIIGGPPVGSRERRRIDETKVEQIKERMRRELAAEAQAAAEARRQAERSQRPSPMRDTEDALPSPSDQRVPSILEMEALLEDELRVPLDELLPPLNDHLPTDDNLNLPSDRFPLDPVDDPLEPTSREPIPRASDEEFDNADSARPSRLHQTRQWIHQPVDTPPPASLQNRIVQPLDAPEDAAHRVAALSRVEKRPTKSNFVKQPD